MDRVRRIVKLRREGRREAVATIVSVQGSVPSFRTAKMLVRDENGSIAGTIGGGCGRGRNLASGQGSHGAGEARTLKFNFETTIPSWIRAWFAGHARDFSSKPVHL